MITYTSARWKDRKVIHKLTGRCYLSLSCKGKKVRCKDASNRETVFNASELLDILDATAKRVDRMSARVYWEQRRRNIQRAVFGR